MPHLPPGTGASRDDLVLTDAAASPFFREIVLVEEKLDGASVSVWLDETNGLAAATRGGVGAIDRANQLGPLRAWIAERSAALRELLSDGATLYAEWLWFVHGIRYERLCDVLVGLDLLDADGRFVSVETRNERLADAGVAVPPELARDVLHDARGLEALQGKSRLTDQSAEGLVVRRLNGGAPRMAKALAPGFRRVEDRRFGTGERNVVAASAR